MASQDSIQKTLTVALLLCFVCSVIVSAAAVILRPMQESNKALDKKKNILLAAGLYQENVSVDEQFSVIQTRIVDLSTGLFVDVDDVDAFDQRKSAKDPATSQVLSSDADIAKISRRENQAVVERAMDSMDQERERGITILAKCTSVQYDPFHLQLVENFQ